MAAATHPVCLSSDQMHFQFTIYLPLPREGAPFLGRGWDALLHSQSSFDYQIINLYSFQEHQAILIPVFTIITTFLDIPRISKYGGVRGPKT